MHPHRMLTQNHSTNNPMAKTLNSQARLMLKMLSWRRPPPKLPLTR